MEYAPVAEQNQENYQGFYAAEGYLERADIEAEAWLLINNRSRRPAAEVPKQERQDNARTALMEALTASGHLSVVKIDGSLEDINHQVLSRLLSGWDQGMPWHEKQRRFNELCNELIIQKVHTAIDQDLLDPATEVLELSDYPLALDDQAAMDIGYRASNRKGMVRSTRLQKNPDGTYSRVIEQASRAQGTAATSLKFLNAAGVQAKQRQHADLSTLSTPVFYSRGDYADGVVDVMRLLDRQYDRPVLYGDGPERWGRHVSYEELREESARREQEIEVHIDELAQLEQQLAELKAEQIIDEETRLNIFKEQVNRVLNAICTLEPNYAADTFGPAAGEKFAQAALLFAEGRGDEAQQLLESAEYLKELVTFCGMSLTVKEAQAKGLNVSGFQELLEKGRANWKWKKGICNVKECPSRPARTEVGPCSVCRRCQGLFDAGKEPKKVYGLSIFNLLFSKQQNT